MSKEVVIAAATTAVAMRYNLPSMTDTIRAYCVMCYRDGMTVAKLVSATCRHLDRA